MGTFKTNTAPPAPNGSRDIVNINYTHRPFSSAITLCFVTLEGGFTVVGQTGTADPEAYDREAGEKWSLKDARDKLEVLAAYDSTAPKSFDELEKAFSDDVQQDVCVKEQASNGTCAPADKSKEEARWLRQEALNLACRLHERTGNAPETVLRDANMYYMYVRG